MAYVLPIPLPQSLVSERRVVAKHDFTHAHHTVAFGPDGRGYVHSEMFYNYLRYDQGDGEIAATVVTLLSPDFSITGQAWLEDLHHELTHDPKGGYVFNNSIAPLAVTPRSEVLFTTSKNRMFVYDADVKSRLARFDPLAGDDAGFSDVVVVPQGLVCIRDRRRVGVVTAPEAFASGLPDVHERADLGELAMRDYRGRFAALDLERILATTFTSRSRSGWIDQAAFAYQLVGGAAFPLGAADTPYAKGGTHDDSYVAHRGLGGWLVRSDTALHVFDRDGARALRLGLAEDERFEAVVPLTLLSVSPRGELVMVHNKHHVLVVSDPVDGLGAIEAVLAEVGAVYAAELKRLKKAVPYASSRWFGFEPKTPRASASVPTAKAKKRKPAPDPVVEAAPPPAASPAEAVSLAPHDLATLSVYADSLADSDPAYGEYINTSIQLHGLSEDDADHARLAARVRELFRSDGARWLRAWNDPNALYEQRFDSFCGLPRSVSIDGFPTALEALDRQTLGLPIQLLAIKGMAIRGIRSLDVLALLTRITELLISGDSKHKLAKPLLAWIAERGFANLRALYLYTVTVTGAGLCEAIAGMPRLEGITISGGTLSAEGLEVLSESAAAARLVKLALNYNPLGSAAAPLFARFPRLDSLSLTSVDLGDDIAESPPPHIAATKLSVDDNPRLGGAGLAWLVKAMPALRAIRLPRALGHDGVDALAPVASQLEAIDASWMDAGTKEAIVARIVPQTRSLCSLDVTGEGGGFVERIMASTSLTKLELGQVTDEDVAALAGAQTVVELYVGGGATDDNLSALARNATLAKLRTLHVHSRIGDAGIAALLGARWPKFGRLELMYAQIADYRRILPPRGRPFTLRLFKCEITRSQLDHLREEWGEHLIT